MNADIVRPYHNIDQSCCSTRSKHMYLKVYCDFTMFRNCREVQTNTMSENLRVVHKLKYDEQSYLSIPVPTKHLEDSTLRVQVQMIGLSNNNLAYCLAGSYLHWWDAFPIPSTAPAPYNNSAEYGIAPGWGYAIILESRIGHIPAGRVLYGFLPISSHTVDLNLRPSGVEDQWIEVSPHRSKVMSMYQRYDLMPEDFDIDNPRAAWTANLIRCEAGMVLCKYVLPQDEKEPIHPFGQPVSTWSTKEADLSGACLVVIASGTKTAKAFIWHLANRGQEKKPEYSLIEVTSGDGCKSYLRDISFKQKTISYESVSASNSFPPHRKFILFNCGGRGNAFENVYNAIHDSQPDAQIVSIQIGSEPKVGTPESMQKNRALLARLNAIQMNTTAIRDEAVAKHGEKKYFQDLDGDFQTLLNEQISSFNGRVLGMTLKLSQGLQTEDGVDGLWKRIIQGQTASDEAIAVRL